MKKWKPCKELQHLSTSEINGLSLLCEDVNYPVNELMEQFHITGLSFNELIKKLPGVRTELVCESCGQYMYREINRHSDPTVKNQIKKYYCLSCHHEYEPDAQFNTCHCFYCENKKSKLIHNYFNKELSNPCQLKDLSIDDFIYISIHIEPEYTSEQTLLMKENEVPAFLRDPVSMDEMTLPRYNRYRSKNCIMVDTNLSNLDSFRIDHEGNISYHPKEVYLRTNIEMTTIQYKLFRNGLLIPLLYDFGALDLYFQEILVQSALEYFYKCASVHGMKLSQDIMSLAFVRRFMEKYPYLLFVFLSDKIMNYHSHALQSSEKTEAYFESFLLDLRTWYSIPKKEMTKYINNKSHYSKDLVHFLKNCLNCDVTILDLPANEIIRRSNNKALKLYESLTDVKVFN